MLGRYFPVPLWVQGSGLLTIGPLLLGRSKDFLAIYRVEFRIYRRILALGIRDQGLSCWMLVYYWLWPINYLQKASIGS